MTAFFFLFFFATYEEYYAEKLFNANLTFFKIGHIFFGLITIPLP